MIPDWMQQDARKAVDRENPAIQIYEALMQYIEEFQKGLDGEHEIGATLVSFGNTVTIHVTEVSKKLPALICFTGYTEKLEKVSLVQHCSQLSFLLTPVKKMNETPRRIGFIQEN